MKYCKTCGSEVKEGQKFCPKCGTSLVSEDPHRKTCPVCHKECSVNDKKCPDCGYDFELTNASNTSRKNSYLGMYLLSGLLVIGILAGGWYLFSSGIMNGEDPFQTSLSTSGDSSQSASEDQKNDDKPVSDSSDQEKPQPAETKPEPEPEPALPAPTGNYMTNYEMIIRKMPGKGSERVGLLPERETVSITDTVQLSDGSIWGQINGDNEQWVCIVDSEYLYLLKS